MCTITLLNSFIQSTNCFVYNLYFTSLDNNNFSQCLHTKYYEPQRFVYFLLSLSQHELGVCPFVSGSMFWVHISSCIPQICAKGHSYLTNDHHFRSIAMVKIIKMHTTFVYWWWLACTGAECPFTKSILCLANDQAKLPLHNSSHYGYVLNHKATNTIHKLSGCKWLSWRSHSHSSLTTTWCTAILRHGIRWNFQPKWPGYCFQTLIEHCFALCINNHAYAINKGYLSNQMG